LQHNGTLGFEFGDTDQLFVSGRVIQSSFSPWDAERPPISKVALPGGPLRRAAMDRRMAMVISDAAQDTRQDTREDEVAYVAGWTISGLATLGTIIAVWIFAI
jgi:hypothetical protein